MTVHEMSVDLIAIMHDGSTGIESVLVQPIGQNRFRLLCSPGLVQGIAAGDEFELASNERGGYRLLKRGGNVCVQLIVPVDKVAECRRTLLPLVHELRGRLDGDVSFRTLANLVFTIPVDAGFPAIQRIMARGQTIAPKSEWFYGNVYDPTDGTTPLNWWE